METAAKLSSQPRTESCVMSGNGHCEAETGRLQAGTSVNDKIAPKSIEMEVADLIPQKGRQEHGMRYGKYPVMLPGFVPPACSQRIFMGTREIRRVQAELACKVRQADKARMT